MSELLKIKPPGKTFPIKCPLSSISVFVRTEMTKEKNNLFHALALASNPTYLFSSDIDRDKIVNVLIEQINQASWNNKSSSNKNEAIYAVSKNILKELVDSDSKYKMIETKKIASSIFTDEKSSAYYKILFELIDMDRWKKILKMETKEAMVYFDNLVKRKLDPINEPRKKLLQTYFSNLLSAVKTESLDCCYQKYKSSNPALSLLNQKDLELIQSTIKTDIFLLDSKTFLPNTTNKSFTNNKQAVILLDNITDKKIEVVGKLLAGNAIKRILDSSDEVVKKIKACFDRKVLKNEYSDLYKIIYSNKAKSSPKRKSERQSVESDKEESSSTISSDVSDDE